MERTAFTRRCGFRLIPAAANAATTFETRVVRVFYFALDRLTTAGCAR
jgi:hypothetical protein